jgi:hypothetical protein
MWYDNFKAQSFNEILYEYFSTVVQLPVLILSGHKAIDMAEVTIYACRRHLFCLILWGPEIVRAYKSLEHLLLLPMQYLVLMD